ncbi:MAG TPA: hypothetical protein VN841_21715 [Bryobacteraceae bacterium]|nr:hypothetical protein [Bryobacteraceae bacterium]
MQQISKAPLLLVSAALLTASGPAWTGKPVQQWNEQDAKQVLSGSPWVKKAQPVQLPNVSEAARRQSGRMGGGQGVNLGALSTSALTGIGEKAEPTRHRRRGPSPVEVRWESALPVRTAEQAAHEDDPPAWEGEMYAIAVYDVPGLDIDSKWLSAELQRAAFLRLGKKDLRPARVDLLPQEGDLTTVLFLFPRSVKITLEDKRIEFTTVFGRLSVTQYFNPREMQFQGKLEL